MWPVSFLVSPPRRDGQPDLPEYVSDHGRFSAGGMIMFLFIASLSISFVAVFVGYVILRIEKGPPQVAVRMPELLWVSTALMLASSGAIQLALWAVRKDAQHIVCAALVAATALSVAFLLTQTMNLFLVVAQHISTKDSKPVAFFYFLVLLHALHILGGFVALGFALVFAFRGLYTRTAHVSLRYTAIYWYFLDGAWLAIFALLLTF